MIKAIFFLCLSCVSLCAYAQQPSVYQDTIPFRNDLGIITVPITFNGVEKQFIFDTGAQFTVGFSWVKEDLKPTRKAINVNSSNGSRTKMSFYKSGTIQLGSKTIKKHKIIQAEDSDIFTCYKIDGILGVDITKHFNWIIDYDQNVLIMSPSDFYPEEIEGMYELDFDFSNNKPFVFMETSGQRLQYLLDTGASGSDINKKAFINLNIDQYPHAKFYSGFYDLNGTLTKTFDNWLLLTGGTSGQVTLAPEMDYSEKSSKIGNSLWKGKRIFLSMENDQLFVSESHIKNNPWSYDCSAVYSEGAMRVYKIREGSEAWNQGIRQGDKIQSYNGNIFTDFCTLDTFQRELTQEHKDLIFVFDNGIELNVSHKQILKSP